MKLAIVLPVLALTLASPTPDLEARSNDAGRLEARDVSTLPPGLNPCRIKCFRNPCILHGRVCCGESMYAKGVADEQRTDTAGVLPTRRAI